MTVDLAVTGQDQTTLVFTATGVATGPGTANQDVPDEKKAAVLDAFSADPARPAPSVRGPPDHRGARGSDVIIEGITEGVTIRLDAFRQS